ncbi:activator of 90 kDa heat shock protein ATPase1-like [Tropilaelaps mercedesae]|uniref:Activator of 90 kDa heat shock protein ATPase1-like n=1 Tax=Tropilaelaps mercedesae TaxID=418985 RepID=A0A1V9XZZ8_9ACAR|nr:activator of 90 kDa heat shock protein ATPase1-like [Tropilaelaps mercedesae]
MAKWGEGDPRWIVEERPDATNVNNWHWTEKNACQWSKDKLNSLFADLEINDSIMCVQVKELKKCEGEATANNRKAKLIFFYEWDLELEWEGHCAGSDQVVKGRVEIPNLSDENDIDEVTVNVILVDPDRGAIPEKIKGMMRSKGIEVIRSKLEEYVSSLKTDFSQGLILPTKDGSADAKPSGVNTTATKGKTGLNKSSTYKPQVEAKSSGLTISTKQLTMNEEFKCTADELYRAFTVPEMVQAFTRGPAQMVHDVGGRFQMLDTNVEGKFVRLAPPNELEFEWRFKSWPAEHYSLVKLSIEQVSVIVSVMCKSAELRFQSIKGFHFRFRAMLFSNA